MTVIKNKSTERGREFWDHVESVARHVRECRSTGYVSCLSGCPVCNVGIVGTEKK